MVTAFLVTSNETTLMKPSAQHEVLTRRIHDSYFNVRLLDNITVDDKYIFIINALINTLRARLTGDEFLEIQILGYDETGFNPFTPISDYCGMINYLFSCTCNK